MRCAQVIEVEFSAGDDALEGLELFAVSRNLYEQFLWNLQHVRTLLTGIWGSQNTIDWSEH